jgi:hypothetical protein
LDLVPTSDRWVEARHTKAGRWYLRDKDGRWFVLLMTGELEEVAEVTDDR